MFSFTWCLFGDPKKVFSGNDTEFCIHWNLRSMGNLFNALMCNFMKLILM